MRVCVGEWHVYHHVLCGASLGNRHDVQIVPDGATTLLAVWQLMASGGQCGSVFVGCGSVLTPAVPAVLTSAES